MNQKSRAMNPTIYHKIKEDPGEFNIEHQEH